MKNIVILISGTGSNMAAIVQAQRQQQWRERHQAEVVAVISNRADAAGLQKAQEAGLATQVVEHKSFPTREAFDAELARAVQAYDPALVVLAGFMRVLTPVFVEPFERRLINIHPSLLPAFPGLHTHQRALDAGCRFTGATVHWVTPELDAGPIIDQVAVPILPGDTAQSLTARVQTQEYLLYPRAILQALQTITA
ncbi:phosphoribosylglycinamide formyltransferase [Allofranklinella schreckenbergeri]|uniref:Phosphoribosylglycinamide formyltransferase n=1 Tax=Allofranklinella schreckenbergeri TaxID=1076744 RepID=A0A3M6QEC1_9BURK|nr:phosphoribosylglycinamide formyltransferase [Allofranklinella schreckenbergeri]RMX01367.1 phosphoribosylglycinamide formyltransferase [Allofranklinella schreckenbergeri]RRD41467.1 phosphoribosylglycinamide formyltransferase [Comamonadaceae bacterium OH3737_COT-264]